MSARDKLAGSPRHAVRWVYLVRFWPEGDDATRFADHAEAILAAPPEVVIEALAFEVEHLFGVIDEHREARDVAEEQLETLRAAVRAVLEACAPGPVGQLALEVAP